MRSVLRFVGGVAWGSLLIGIGYFVAAYYQCIWHFEYAYSHRKNEHYQTAEGLIVAPREIDEGSFSLSSDPYRPIYNFDLFGEDEDHDKDKK